MSDFLSVRFHHAELGPLSALDWSVLLANGTIVESGSCLLEDLLDEVDQEYPFLSLRGLGYCR